MILLPVVARELALVVRRASMYRMRVGGAVVGLLAMGWILLVSSAGLASGTQGNLLFRGVAGIVFYYCLAVGPTLVADAVSSERRQGTLGLLFLTDLRGYDVILGKLAAASTTAVFTVLSLIPMSSVAVLLGGVTLADVGRMALVWISTLFASASIGICVSSYCTDDRKAMVGAAFGVFAVGYAAYGPYYILKDLGYGWAEIIGSFSAGFAYHTTAEWIPGTRRILPFVASIGFLWGVGVLALMVASRQVELLAAGQPKSVWRARFEALANWWAYGAPGERARRRGRLLDHNPFLWLLSRHQRKKAYMWGFLGCMFGIWLWIFSYVSGLVWDWSFNGFVFLFLGAMVKNWWSSEVGERFVEDRQNGALELVFTTSATPEDYAKGQGMALRRVFGGPILGMAFAQLVWLYLAIPRFGEAEGRLALLSSVTIWGVLAVDLWALKWLGLWHGLVYPSSNRASTATLMRLGIGPWLLVIGFISVYTYWINYATGRGIVHGDTALFVVSYAVTSLVFAVIFGLRARRRFLLSFRHVASEGLQEAAIEAALARAPVLPVRTTDSAPGAPLAIEPLRRRHWLRRHWLATGFATLILLVIGSGVGFRWYWEWRMESKLKALAAAGIPMTVEDFNLVQGLSERDGEMMRFWDSIRSIQGRNNLHRIRVEQLAVGKASKEVRELAVKLVESNPEAGEWLKTVGKLKRHPGHLKRGTFQSGNLNALGLSQLGHLSTVRGILQWERGEREAAVETAIQLLELCRYMGTSEAQFEQVFAWDLCMQQTVALIQLLLNSGPLSEDARKRMDGWLQELGKGDLVRLNQMAALVTLIDFQQNPQRWWGGNPFAMRIPATIAFMDGAARFLGIRARSEVEFLEELSSLVEASSAPDPALYLRMGSLPRRDLDTFSYMVPTGIHIRMQAVSMASYELRSVGLCRSLRLALRADAHHERTGVWTAEIGELIRPVETSMFLSPMTGKPLILERLPRGTGIHVTAIPPEERSQTSGGQSARVQGEFVIDRSAVPGGGNSKP